MTPDLLPPRIARRITVDDSGCWLWTGVSNYAGYGSIGFGGRKWRAHRLTHSLLVGGDMDGLELDHLCRVRNCVNPEHLEPVTHRENVLRGNGIAASNAAKTRCKWGHEFTPENTYTYSRGGGIQRCCKPCALARNAAKATSGGVKARSDFPAQSTVPAAVAAPPLGS